MPIPVALECALEVNKFTVLASLELFAASSTAACFDISVYALFMLQFELCTLQHCVSHCSVK